MKKIFALLVLVMFVTVGSVFADPETFTWTNPTTYTDGSAISSSDQALIKTHLFWGTTSSGTWTEFAVVSGGAVTYSGTPPSNYGVVAYYTLTTELGGKQSVYMTPAVTYTRPYPACNPPSGLTIK